MNRIFRVAAKEFASFFSSPVAFIFMGVFLAANLFIFFWVETFFAANITEMRSLFSWMPILLIFLTAAITMRMWAEERRAGTLEFLLTSPVSPASLVLGKFFGCLVLVIVSLILTLPLPITVSFIGDLDWGPVFGGYLAAIFLAGAYIAIGLYVSVKSENQIVSLIVSVLVCAIFFLIGSSTLGELLGTRGAEILALLGSGSRFDSITRGVIDIRDLYYYVTIAGVFLVLNVYGLEKIRWAGNPSSRKHRVWQGAVLLVVLNFIAANFWLAPVGKLRMDLTDGNLYSISDTTRNYLNQLREPLLIRGYFSKQTHPKLAPLVPRLKDLLKEYAIAGGQNVTVEFVDPLEHPDLEKEAGEKYGIKPVPFQTASKYQASVTNSYFNILIKYGDQYEVLSFDNLIEVKSKAAGDVDVELDNPEYNITRSIRKALFAYQGGGNVFDNISGDVTFTGYFSADDQLPESLVNLKKDIADVLAEIGRDTGDRLKVNYLDPDAGDGKLAQQLSDEYGFRPMAAGLFSDSHFWFYMVMQNGGRRVDIELPQDLSKESLTRSLQAGLKRFAAGMTKTIALNVQPATQAMPQYGIPAHGKTFGILKEMLSQEYTVVDADLKNGTVPEQSDLLVLASPENLDEKQLFAVDQFLMHGGTIIVATSPFDISTSRTLSLVPMTSGLEKWLESYGLSMESELVMDTQNSPFPIPVNRDVGGFTVQETKLLAYPAFVDVRANGMIGSDQFYTGLSQLTINWASPITVDADKNRDRTVTKLLQSSENSWLSKDTTVQPDFEAYPNLGFSEAGEKGHQLLGVMVQGSFQSFFKGKDSPLLKKDGKEEGGQNGEDATAADKKPEKQIISGVVESSPASSRIIVLSSNTFLADMILRLSSSVKGSAYFEPAKMVANIADSSLDDSGLSQIRGRSHFARPLIPMEKGQQMFFEYLNYALAIIALFLVWIIRRIRHGQAKRREQNLLQSLSGRV